MTNKVGLHITLTVSCLLSPAVIAFADDNELPLVPLPSISDYTQGNGWGSAIGIKGESSAVYHGSDQYQLEVKPDGAIQWRRNKHLFYWEGFDLNHTALGWRSLTQDKWMTDIGLRHEIVIPVGRSKQANIELPHRGSHVLAFYETKYSIGDNWKNWISGKLSAGPSSYGWQASIAFGHVFFQGVGNTGIELSVFSSFGDDKNFNNYFGLSDFDANVSGMPAVDLEGGYRSSGLSLLYREKPIANIELIAKARIESYSDSIRESELVHDSSETNISVSVLWNF